MVELCLQAITIALQQGIPFLLAHPEDLGSTAQWGDDIRPASIWQSLPIRNWVQQGAAFSGAFFQCELGAPSPKPTRLLTSIKSLIEGTFVGLPTFSARSQYLGPLPARCQCGRVHTTLIRKTSQGDFATSAAQMDAWLALHLFRALLKRAAEGPARGGAHHPAGDHGQDTMSTKVLGAIREAVNAKEKRQKARSANRMLGLQTPRQLKRSRAEDCLQAGRARPHGHLCRFGIRARLGGWWMASGSVLQAPGQQDIGVMRFRRGGRSSGRPSGRRSRPLWMAWRRRNVSR